MELMGKSLVSVSFCALLVLGLAAKAAWRILRSRPEQQVLARSTIDAGLFWGAFAFVVGLFHTVLGLIVTAMSVRGAAPVDPEEHGLIATGVMAALGAGAYGTFVFLLAALLWFGFRHWHQKAVQQAT
ncbi:MAG: MotA/TolQ/ExbB proton channel family protein [Dehalococcoidia bacterium]